MAAMIRRLTFGLVLCCSIPCGRAAPPWAPPGVVISHKIATNGEPIRLPVNLSGKQCWFIVDTGCRDTIVSPSCIPGGSQKVSEQRIPSPDGIVNNAVYAIDSFRVANLSCDWLKQVVAVDLTDLERDLGVRVDGILGMSFLSRYIFHCDLDNGICLLCEPSAVESIPGDAIRLELDKYGRPYVAAAVDGSDPISFLIDTGLIAGIMTERAAAERLRQESRLNSAGVWTRTIDLGGNAMPVEMFTCRRFSIGEHTHDKVVIEPGALNAIGLFFLCRYRFTIEFGRRTVHLVPSARYNLNDRSDSWGIVDKRDDTGDRLVTYIANGSTAQRAGLRVGDRINAVNGARVSQMSEPQWNRLCTFPGSEDILLLINRGRDKITVRIPGG